MRRALTRVALIFVGLESSLSDLDIFLWHSLVEGEGTTRQTLALIKKKLLDVLF